MVSQATINAKVSKGFAKAAAVLGASCPWYRPTSAMVPLATRFGTIFSAFQVPNAGYAVPSTFAKPLWWALVDATMVMPGDILIDPTLGTFFICSTEPLSYPLAVGCNRMVNILRPPAQTALGATGYGGDIAADETILMRGWPASILNGTKGERSDANLPGDIRLPWAAIIMPAYPGVIIRTSDVLIDDLGRRLKISACELTSLGWRLTAAFESQAIADTSAGSLDFSQIGNSGLVGVL